MIQSDYYKIGIGSNPEEWVFSNSSLSTINPEQGGHPKKMVNFFSGDKEEKDDLSLERGKLLHLYMEKPYEFIVSQVPKPNDKLGMAADALLNEILTNEETTEFTDEDILRHVRIVGWNPKWGDEAILKNTKDQIRPYIEEVLAGKDKIFITIPDKEILSKCIDSMNTHKDISKILFTESDDVIEVQNELKIFWTGVAGLKCKAKLDKVIIDTANKTITIYDLKSTSKPLSLFQKTFEYYRYYRQLFFYYGAICEWLAQKNYKESYKISVNIIACETVGNFNCGIYKISDFWHSKGLEEILFLTNLVLKHKELGNWDYILEELEVGYLSFQDEFITK